ncbi:MAG: amidophosphoribosyltransferase [Endomicrobiia bacterium]
MCGLFGIYGASECANITYFGLYALQHRGQESAGIVVSDGEKLKTYKGMGLVNDVFNEENLKQLTGHIAIGHVRYSTTGPSVIENAQPFVANFSSGQIAIAHNGNLTNTRYLRNKLESEGSIFQTTMDSEIIVHLIARSRKSTIIDRIIDALNQVKGAYSLLFLVENKIIAIRDPNGFRPLWLGRLNNSVVFGSETCAFDIIQAEAIRELEPGEIVIVDKSGINSLKPFKNNKNSFCIFENIYFARPDSNIFGGSVYFTRKQLGKQLAKEHPANADIVLAIPDSGNYAALGFSEESKIPFEMGIIRNHYIGRTFIQPFQTSRELGVKLKLNPVKELLKGKKIVIVEDSIVRGTTSKLRINTLKKAGAREINIRVSCPPIKFPCYYGIDFPTKEELVASKNSIEEIANLLGVNSLKYLSLEGLLNSMPISGKNFCTACFDGNYPVETYD